MITFEDLTEAGLDSVSALSVIRDLKAPGKRILGIIVEGKDTTVRNDAHSERIGTLHMYGTQSPCIDIDFDRVLQRRFK